MDKAKKIEEIKKEYVKTFNNRFRTPEDKEAYSYIATWAINDFIAEYIYNKCVGDKPETSESNAILPDVMWRFCAYASEKHYESGNPYFTKYFTDHAKMKIFSGEHAYDEKPLYPNYCSMYWKIENAT